MKIQVFPECETLPVRDGAIVHLALKLKAPAQPPDERRPVAFCLVIDRSGSMSGSPLNAAKEAVRKVLKNLHHDDYFSLIVFSDVAEVIVPLDSKPKDREITNAIDQIAPHGSTNLVDGWMRGRDELRKAPREIPRRLLLLTDGRLNVGITKPDEALQIIEVGRDNDSVATSCLGIGDFYDDQLLAAIAERCGGSFYDVDSTEQLSDVFTNELRNLQQTVVENLQLRIYPNDLCKTITPLANVPFYRNKGEIKIPVGNLASDEKRILILKLEMTIPPIAKRKSSDADLLEIEATFESHRSHQIVSHKWNRVVKTRFTNRRDEPKFSPDATGFISAQMAGKTLCEAVADAESGRILEAKTRLKTKIRQLEKEPPSNGRSDGLKLLTEFHGILKAKGKWTARDQKRARYRCHFYRKMSSKELWLGPRNREPTFSRQNRKPSARANKIKTTVPAPNFFCLLSELQVQSRSNQKQMMTHFVSHKIFSFLLLTLFSAFPVFATSESSFGTLGNYNLSTLLESNIPPPLLGDEIDSVEKWEAKAAEIREIWVDYIGGIPERVPVEFEILETSSEKDHNRIKLVFQTVHDDQIPAYLLLPKGIEDSGQKYPAILALHPTNAEGKDSIATPWSRPNRQYAFELVSRGYVVLAPDAMTSGDRIFENERHFRSAPFYEKHPEWSTVAKNIVDHMQAVDLLESLPYVDASRIGTIGHSFGGYNAYFLTSIDPRIAVAVSSCGFNPFTGSSNPQHWGIRNWYTHLPRFSEDMENNQAPFDFHEIAALTAPRPFLNYSTQQDHIFPDWRPIAESMADLHKLYSLFDANDRFRSILTSGGHDFPPDIREIAYDFLDQWLKK